MARATTRRRPESGARAARGRPWRKCTAAPAATARPKASANGHPRKGSTTRGRKPAAASNQRKQRTAQVTATEAAAAADVRRERSVTPRHEHEIERVAGSERARGEQGAHKGHGPWAIPSPLQ